MEFQDLDQLLAALLQPDFIHSDKKTGEEQMEPLDLSVPRSSPGSVSSSYISSPPSVASSTVSEPFSPSPLLNISPDSSFTSESNPSPNSSFSLENSFNSSVSSNFSSSVSEFDLSYLSYTGSELVNTPDVTYIVLGLQEEMKRCCNCGTDRSSVWRGAGRGAGQVCNACGLYYRTHGRPRPPQWGESAGKPQSKRRRRS